VTPRTIPDALAAALRHDGARPLVTWIGPDGQRTELSVRSFENNVAKAANLLRDDGDVVPGSRVVLHLPLHWQTSVWLGACAATGGVAWLGGDAGDSAVEVSVVDPDHLTSTPAPITLAVSLHPFGLPFTTPLPDGVLDAAHEVRAHPDTFTPYDVITGDDPWLREVRTQWTQDEALSAARRLAHDLRLEQGGRLLCTRTLDDVSVLALLALPLAIDGSVVLLTDPDADPITVAHSERCQAVLR
jgi:uncharacterized protein (TIGR03089 family)